MMITPPRAERPAHLRRGSDFLTLWTGQTLSQVGSRITRGGLPFIAVTMLNATPGEMGTLTAIAALPALVLGLFAGAWVDRLPRRPVLIACDAARALLLLSIPLLAVSGRLSLTAIMLVMGVLGVFDLTFEVAYRAILPSIVPREHLEDANAKLATTDAIAEIGGPSLAGVLIQVLSAPLAIAFDALSFAVAAVFSVSLRVKETPGVSETAPALDPVETAYDAIAADEGDPPTPEVTGSALLREIAEGWRAVMADRVLRALLIAAAARALLGACFGALYEVYTVRELGFSASLLGIVIACGGIGALIGAVITPRITARFGATRALIGSLLLSSIANLLIPLAAMTGSVAGAAALLIAAQILGDALMMIFWVNEVTMRQTRTESRLLGRVNAAFEWSAGAIYPAGALIGGAFAERASAGAAMLLAAAGIIGVAVFTARTLRRA